MNDDSSKTIINICVSEQNLRTENLDTWPDW